MTLVSEDEHLVHAHKVVLSASSGFFKNILTQTSQTHNPHDPLIYLSGVSSKFMDLIVDFIYQGEAQIEQDDLDRFLEIAHKLKIDGLVGSENKQLKKEPIEEVSE